jgi:hypothetical protein
MGQYWKAVNLDKMESVNPHSMGNEAKLWEILANHPTISDAVLILTANMPEPRGGGDLNPDPVIGRWAGDRIAIVGDYAEDGDLPGMPMGAIYDNAEDITELVIPVIERELDMTFDRSGTWPQWTHNQKGG